MSTLSVPLTKNLEEMIGLLVKRGYASNKAEVMRKALLLLVEEEAVSAVLKSEQEAKEGKILRGDLRSLTRKIP